MMVRAGRQPVFIKAEMARAVSPSAAWPEIGSSAPFTQAS